MEKSADELISILCSTLPGDMNRPTNLSGCDFSGKEITGVDFSFINLSRADFTDCILKKVNFFKCNLDGSRFDGAEITMCEFTGATLKNSSFNDTHGVETGFGAVDMTGSRFVGACVRNCTFSKSIIADCDFSMADLYESRMMECRFCGTDFTNADLRRVNFSFSSFDYTVLRESDLRESSLSYVSDFETADWFATDFRNINFVGAYQLRRFIIDQNYLEEFKRKSFFNRIVFYFWLISSDCGRSMIRWVLLTVGVALVFSFLYATVAIDYGFHRTWMSPLYFSFVTLTTLGFGDIVPISVPAQVLVIIEVLTGYGLLGGALAIFSNKIARRGD
ncbi:MAG: pentapeptide repeat-containing protein [Deltaproteobacteria bacterium]|nr:pentapeptide repeat-containing protein [Deltaproteobacteria bacterium]